MTGKAGWSNAISLEEGWVGVMHAGRGKVVVARSLRIPRDPVRPRPANTYKYADVTSALFGIPRPASVAPGYPTASC